MFRILDAIEDATGLKPIPLDTDKVEKSIIYKFYQSAFLRYRLEIRVIDLTLEGCEDTSNLIINRLSDFGDLNKIEGIASIELNGGGVLKDYNTNTIQRLMYFDVVKEN